VSVLAYDTYRDSGAEWLGAVPDHWEVLPARHVFVERDERSATGDETLLTVSHITGVTPRSEKSVTMIEAETTEGYKRCFPGDLVINTLWAWMGAVGVAKVEGIVSPAYNVYCPRSNYVAAYVEAVVRMPAFAREAERYSKGVWSSRLRLYPAEFFQIFLPIPPIDEQAAIAAFLEGETTKIAALVAAQRRLVALLKERISSQVLSKAGLAAAKEMRLEHACTVIQRPVEQAFGEIYEPLGLFNRGRGLFHKDPRRMEEMGDSDFFWVQTGDLIISGQFAWEGAVALAGAAEAGCVVSHRYPILRGNPDVVMTEYLFAYLLTDHGNFLMNECSRGSAGRNRPLNISLLLKEIIAIPEMRVQESVADAVHALAKLQAEVVQQETLLQERRSALISAAVTGKIDVRDIARSEAAAA
jgi:type I restriction enzyme S subunit